MKTINENEYQYIVCYNKDDFTVNQDCKLVEDSASIYSTDEAFNDNYSYEDAKLQIMGDYFNYFETEKDAKVYILYNQFDKKPVSIAIYTKLDKDAYLLEYIATNKFERSLGNASYLAKHSFAHLRNSGITEVALVVNNKNYKSQNLQQTISRFNGVDVTVNNDGEHSHYVYHIENLDESVEDDKYTNEY